MKNIQERRNVKLDLRVTPSELSLWKAEAKAAGCSLSGLVRGAMDSWLNVGPTDEAEVLKPDSFVVHHPPVERSFKPDFGSRLKGGDGA
jgi:hypothetical protein